MLTKLVALTVLIMLIPKVNALTSQELNQIIIDNKAKWIASPNSFSNLTPDEKKRLLGAPALDVKEFIFEADQKNHKAFPDKLDWRNKNGIDYMPPITNQGNCGSCVAFAAVGALEAQINIANNWPGLNLNFSEQQLFACGGGSCGFGWFPFMALFNMRTQGIVDEACLHYTSGSTGLDVDCQLQCSDAEERKYFLTSYVSNKSQSVMDANDVIRALQNGPLLGTMNVYDDFFSYKSGIYSHLTGNFAGGHAIVIIGYDAKEKYWIVRNSWGTHWGENGYFKIKFDDLSGVGLTTFSLVVAPPEGLVQIERPEFKELISGQYRVELSTTQKNTDQLKLELKKDGVISSFTARRSEKSIDRFVVDLDTTKLPDGVYEAKAISTFGKSQIQSQIKDFYILNSNPTMNISFIKPVNNETIRGKYVSEIKMDSSPLEILNIHMNIKYPDGKIVTLKNYHPTSITQMSWRTQFSPNGQYELWVDGFIGSHKVSSDHLKILVSN